MGTRGAHGFVVNGKEYVTYNHFDSYPDGLGANFVDSLEVLLEKYNIAGLKDKVAAIRLIDESEDYSPEDKERYGRYWQNVSTGSDWYSLLRGMQGDMTAYVEEGVMPDGAAFLDDSLFCEYAYIANLDTGKLEFYTGFVKDSNGNYARVQKQGEWSLEHLSSGIVDEMSEIDTKVSESRY